MNIAEILKNCPKGTKLYSPLFGELELDRVKDCGCIVCISIQGTCGVFTREGKYFLGFPDSECLLFPSKDQRDWNKFGTKNHVNDPNELKPFEKVLVRDLDDDVWKCDLFSHLGDRGVFVCLFTWWKQCIPYEGNKHLLGTTDKPE